MTLCAASLFGFASPAFQSPPLVLVEPSFRVQIPYTSVIRQGKRQKKRDITFILIFRSKNKYSQTVATIQTNIKHIYKAKELHIL